MFVSTRLLKVANSRSLRLSLFGSCSCFNIFFFTAQLIQMACESNTWEQNIELRRLNMLLTERACSGWIRHTIFVYDSFPKP